MIRRSHASRRSLCRFLTGAAAVVAVCVVVGSSDTLPQHVAHWIGPPSTFLLQTLGLPAILEGNLILLHEQDINVLGMTRDLTVLAGFCAVVAIAAFVLRRPLWERVLIAASAVPIAFAVLVIRLVSTCILLHWFGPALSMDALQPWMALLMLPAALVLLWLEVVYLQHLVIADDPTFTLRPIRKYALPKRPPASLKTRSMQPTC